MLPSSTASARRSVLQAASSCLPKADCEPKRFIREIRGAAGDLAVGGQGRRRRACEGVEAVDVIGISKGRGFAGAMQAAQFHRPAGHARREEVPSRARRHRRQRVPQPRGQGQADGRASTATSRTTMRNQKLVRVDAENNLLLIRGAVPGPNGGYVVIKKTNKL